MTERRNSQRARRICRETHEREDHLGRRYMICHCGCKAIIWPTVSQWRADHVRRWAEGGRDTADNLRPILVRCDAGKDGKAARDAKIIAHGKRASHRHYGGSKRKGRPMAGTRASGIRIRMNGTVERW
jgi:5-methylcytosine-specific restriction protein A